MSSLFIAAALQVVIFGQCLQFVGEWQCIARGAGWGGIAIYQPAPADDAFAQCVAASDPIGIWPGLVSRVEPCDGATPGVALTWEAPTDNVDGTELTDLAGYLMTCNGQTFDVADPTATSWVVAPELGSGSIWCYVQAYDTSGNVSPPSNSVQFVIPPP